MQAAPGGRVRLFDITRLAYKSAASSSVSLWSLVRLNLPWFDHKMAKF